MDDVRQDGLQPQALVSTPQFLLLRQTWITGEIQQDGHSITLPPRPLYPGGTFFVEVEPSPGGEPMTATAAETLVICMQRLSEEATVGLTEATLFAHICPPAAHACVGVSVQAL